MLALLALVATASAQPAAKATPISALPDRAPPPAVEAAPVPAPPAAVAAIRPLLGARHTEDLPTRAALDTHGDAAAALRWIAAHGEALVEAERAAMLLAAYDDAETTEFCTGLLGGPAHAKIRAGAARCLSGRALVGSPALPALVQAVQAEDERLGLAATEVLLADPDGRAAVAALDLAALPAPVQARIGAALK